MLVSVNKGLPYFLTDSLLRSALYTIPGVGDVAKLAITFFDERGEDYKHGAVSEKQLNLNTKQHAFDFGAYIFSKGIMLVALPVFKSVLGVLFSPLVVISSITFVATAIVFAVQINRNQALAEKYGYNFSAVYE